MGEDRRRRLTLLNGGKSQPRPSLLVTTYTIMIPIQLSKEMEQAYQLLADAHVPGTETPGKWWETCFVYGVRALTNSGLRALQPKNPCGQPGHPIEAFVIEEEPSEANGQQGVGFCSICRDIAEREIASGVAGPEGGAIAHQSEAESVLNDDTAPEEGK